MTSWWRNLAGYRYYCTTWLGRVSTGQQLTNARATILLYFDFFAHCLNLVLEKCAETLPALKDVFSTIGSIYKVTEGSPQQNAVFEEKGELLYVPSQTLAGRQRRTILLL